jgi:type IV pilus assembly protein PilW
LPVLPGINIMTSHNFIVHPRRLHPVQTGFTLVEIMVGLAIGLIATAIIMQVFSVFENQKRTTMGSGDAQTNGSIALYNMTRDIQQGGWAVMPTDGVSTPFKCASLTISGAGATVDRLSPVFIVDGVSDTITIRYGNSGGGGAPNLIGNVTGHQVDFTTNVTDGGVPIPVSNIGCAPGDATLTSQPLVGGACSMSAVSSVVGAQSIIIKDVDPVVAKDNTLACLGKWSEVTFSVINGTLQRQDSPTAAFTPSVAGIVNIQAQYGISAAGLSNQVDAWVDATGAWATPSFSDRNRIKAVRIAVVARNETRDMSEVTDPCSSTIAAAPTGLCAWDATSAQPAILSPAPLIDLSADPDWRHYRYRVYETIIPIRNVVWSRGVL